MDYKKEIGRRIAEARGKKGWTLEQLSAKTGTLSANRISNYETGFRMPKPQEVATLAKQLGVRAAYLMGLDDAQTILSPLEETLVRNWRTLPERERMGYFRQIETLAMTHRDPIADAKVEKSLGATPKDGRKPVRAKGKTTPAGG